MPPPMSQPPLSPPLARLRSIGFAEGVSFLVLLGIAMPLKYLADMPMAVKVVGWAHGVLFILYCLSIADAWRKEGWPLSRVALAFLAAWLPFGPFVFDRKVLRSAA